MTDEILVANGRRRMWSDYDSYLQINFPDRYGKPFKDQLRLEMWC